MFQGVRKNRKRVRRMRLHKRETSSKGILLGELSVVNFVIEIFRV